MGAYIFGQDVGGGGEGSKFYCVGAGGGGCISQKPHESPANRKHWTTGHVTYPNCKLESLGEAKDSI